MHLMKLEEKLYKQLLLLFAIPKLEHTRELDVYKRQPTRQSLHEEYNRLLTEKKKTYVEYRQVRKDMQEYLTAKQTVEHILGMDRKKKEEQQRKER